MQLLGIGILGYMWATKMRSTTRSCKSENPEGNLYGLRSKTNNQAEYRALLSLLKYLGEWSGRRRPAGQTCALLLATTGGRTSEPAAVRGNAGPDRATAGTNGIDRWSSSRQRRSIYSELGEGEVSQKWAANDAIYAALVRKSRIVGGDPSENCFTLTRRGTQSTMATGCRDQKNLGFT